MYERTPKAKFLFHVAFTINNIALPPGLSPGNNFGLYVRNIKLPSYSFNTFQLNQYNRKRVVQTKLKYEPISITFHDDNASIITQLWNSYYIYYYRDGSKPQVIFNGAKGNRPTSAQPGYTPLYNNRTQYIQSVEGDYDWGYVGEPNNLSQLGNNEPIKVPFFKNITIFSFYQHNWTAYTLINPLITGFQHDTHDYDQGGGVMQNTMTVDYETVVYNYGALDGAEPSTIIQGFGSNENYDRRPSPLSTPGGISSVYTPQGMLDAAGGFVRNQLLSGLSNAAQNYVYNGLKQTGLNPGIASALGQQAASIFRNFPTGSPMTSPIRNTMFAFPVAGETPSSLGVAGSPAVGGVNGPVNIPKQSIAGQQVVELNTPYTTEK